MLVALLDGVGLAMFIPLLQQMSGPATEVGSNLGGLDVVVTWLENAGVVFTLRSVLLLILVFFTAKGLFRFAVQYYEVKLNQRFAKQLRNDNVNLLAAYDYAHFAEADAGEIQNSFNAEVIRIHRAYGNYFVVLKNAAMALVYIGLAYLANPGFALLVALLGVAANLLFKRLYRITKKASSGVTQAMNQLQGLLIQSINNFKYLKATNLIDRYKGRITSAVSIVEDQQRKIGVVNAFAAAVREPLVIGLVVVAILVQVTYFEAAFGELILSLLFFYRGLTNVVGIQNSYGMFLGNAGSIDQMRTFVEGLERGAETTGGAAFTGLRKGLELRSLTFRYGDRPVITDLSLKIPAKSTLGIVGESGVGKTTLTNLLAGLYRPEPEQLFVDGVDITELAIASYRNAIGYVTQEPPVFSDTIFHNVTFWGADTPANREKVWAALATANADGFVEELPSGLDEVIGINGLRLSGGQRQRLAIAREVYRQVELLFLDEATSALDSTSEDRIRENLERLAGKFTTVIVAHRLSTIRSADQVLYLQADGGYQIGTFAALLERSAGFRELVRLQIVN